MKIRSAVAENGCLIVLVNGKKTKNNKKNICKTYTHPPPTGDGCVNKYDDDDDDDDLGL